jgi:hypothetical protein
MLSAFQALFGSKEEGTAAAPAAADAAKVETPKRAFRVLSPSLAVFRDHTVKIGIEQTTNELHLLYCGPTYHDVSGQPWLNAPSLGQVTLHETAAGDGLIVLTQKWGIKLTRLKDSACLSEVMFPTFYHQMQHMALSYTTPFRREGHAEYDKLAVIFDKAPVTAPQV